MKRIILIISIVAFGITGFAKSVPKVVIENARAIVAYEVLSHCIVNSDFVDLDSFDIEGFKTLEVTSVNDIREKAPRISDVYKGVLQDVERLSKTDFGSAQEMTAYFADSIFVIGQSNPIRKLAQSDAVTTVSRKIRAKLANLDYIQEMDRVVEIDSQPSNTRTNKNKSNDIMVYIGYILALICALVAAALFFIKEKTQGHIKELKKELEAKKKEMVGLRQDVMSLNQQIAFLQSKLREKETETEELQYSQKQSQHPSAPSTPSAPQHQAVNQYDEENLRVSEQSIFLAAPYAGIFSDAYDTIEEGITLYRLRTFDGQKGEYEFMDGDVNVERASEDPTDNVEVACVIRSQSSIWRQIITEERGIAVKNANGWKIIKKAVVTIV